MAKQFIFALIFCLSISGLMAQPLNREYTSKMQSAILRLDFQSARSLNPYLSTLTSDSEIWSDAYQRFVDYLTTSQLNSSNELISVLEHHINALKIIKLKDEFSYVSRADIHLMISYLEFTNRDYWPAFTHYTKAKSFMDELEEKFPKSIFNQRYALLKLTVDAMASEIIPLPGLKIPTEKRKDQFLQMMNRVLKNPEIPVTFKDETEITTVIYYSFIDPSDDGCYKLIELFGNDWYKKGPLQTYLFVKHANRSGHYNESYKALQFASQHQFTNRFNLLNLQIGNMYLNRMNDSCSRYLNQFAELQKNNRDVAYALLKLAWWNFMSQNPAQTEGYCHVITTQVFPETPDNQQAIYEITLRENWESLLIKARLLFDGGNYTACRDLLLAEQDKVGKLNKLQQTEFAYRMARACDKTGQWEFAIKFYHITMNSGLENQLYYPSYSAYYLGMIYLQQNNKPFADRYFRICIQMKSPIYEESIHRKASNQMN
jgi:hypothetical protein